MDNKVRALAMFSGGLDSQLAVKVLLDQGVEVIAVCFTSPFFGAQRAEKAAAALNVPLKVINVSAEILDLLQNPPHGFGKNINPCIDCHALMMSKCGALLDELGAAFIATGEVLGQRPMSQNFISLGVVAKTSGIADKILRPLSAKLLPETAMEREGLVDRERLLSLNGRSRKPQFALAREYGLTEYPNPAGGCLLTEPEFARRMRALMRIYPQPTVAQIEKLKVGRQFFLSNRHRLCVGKNEADNNHLEKLVQPGDYLLQPAEDIPGPVAILEGPADGAIKELAARIIVRYAKPDSQEALPVEVHNGEVPEIIRVLPLTDDELAMYR